MWNRIQSTVTFRILRNAYTDFTEDKAARLGAALAYYTVFSIAPLLVILISLAGLIFGEEAVRGELFRQIAGLVGAESAKLLQDTIAAAANEKRSAAAAATGLAVVLFGATGLFMQLQDALNTVWEVRHTRKGFFAEVFARWTSLTMVLGIGFVLLVSLFLSAFVSLLAGVLPPRFAFSAALIELLHAVVSFGLTTLLFALMYRLLPGVILRWRDVLFGAVLTASLFTLGKVLLGLYLANVAVGSAYGAAGTIIVLLVWIYYSAQILLFGAECTQAVTRHRRREVRLRPGYELDDTAAWSALTSDTADNPPLRHVATNDGNAF